MPKLNCKLVLSSSRHLSQIYYGFELLAKSGYINLEIVKPTIKPREAVLEVWINDRYKIFYDVNDGINWSHGSEEDAMLYFKKNHKADFYFKRSYLDKMKYFTPEGCIILPLGLNYFINSKTWCSLKWQEKLKYNFQQDKIVGKYLYSLIGQYFPEDFTGLPYYNQNGNILFISRLWNPNEAKSQISFEHRNKINLNRINQIRILKSQYGELFKGGIIDNETSRKIAPDLILPKETTSKKKYLKLVKESNICITTEGLKHSTGWKFAEYIAASKAIITEPLYYKSVGNLSSPQNYLEFNDSEELIQKVDFLLQNRDVTEQMMMNNYIYYQQYLRPDMLILNTLKYVEQKIIENAPAT